MLTLLAQAATSAAPTAMNEYGAIAAVVVAVTTMLTTIGVAITRRNSNTRLPKMVTAQGATLAEHGQKLVKYNDRFAEIDKSLEEMAKTISAMADDTDPNVRPMIARIELLEREVREEKEARATRYREQVAETIKLTETLTRFDEALKFIKSQLENSNGRRR